MICTKCGEEVQDSALLKHLKDYHEQEKDLQVKCPGCEHIYSTFASLRTHWYSKHHASKRKSSDPAVTSASVIKKLIVEGPSRETVSVEVVQDVVLCAETKEQSVVLPSESASVCDPQNDESVARIVPESESQISVPIVPESESQISVPAVDVLHDSVSQNADVAFDSPWGSVDAQGHESTEEEESSDEEDSGLGADSCFGNNTSDGEFSGLESDADDEAEKGMPLEDAVKCVLPQETSPVNESAASYLLHLNSVCNIPSSSIKFVIAETEKIIKDSVMAFVSKLDEKLAGSDVSLDKLVDVKAVADSSSKIFDNLRTVKQQEKYFKKSLGVIEPRAIPLGKVLKKVRVKGKSMHKTVLRSEDVMFIPITEILDKLINHPDFEHLTQKDINSEFLDTYLKGEKCKSNPVLTIDKGAYRFILYYDDVEVCAPLKSKAGAHKLGAFYLQLDNIALHHRSNVSLIFLVALVNANFIKDKKYGIDSALEIIVAELQKFERGVVLPCGKKVHGTLIATIGDNLGSHGMGGFKEGFTAHRCCRHCMATYEDMKKMVREKPELLRTKESHAEQCAQIQTARGKNEALSTEYGVNRDSALNSLASYHVVEGLPPDIMHDLLEGCVPLAIKRLLNHYLGETGHAKKFTLDWLNSAVREFDYGYAETSSKPSEIKAAHLKDDGSLHQSASQFWLLATILPLIIGPLLDKDDKYFENYLDLLEICRIVFSTDILQWMVPYLGDLIEIYLSDYKLLYKANLIPKQHFMIHFPLYLRLYGSLVNYMCMRCEAKHKFFKRLVYVIGCFKNIPASLSYKHQLHFASVLSKSLRKPCKCGPCHLVNVNDCSYRRLFPQYAGNFVETNWLTYDGITLKPQTCYLCVGVRDDLPVFVRVFKVLIHPTVQYVCEKVSTIRRSIYLASYEVKVSPDNLLIVKPETIALHHVLHAHLVKGALYIPMKQCVGGSIL